MRQSYVQFEMQKKLRNSQSRFEKLSLTLSEYKRSRIKEDEISINGKMYDIKSFQINGDKIELLAINDTEEENILQRIKDLITNNNTNPGSEVPSQLTDLITLDYIYPGSVSEIIFFEKQQENFYELFQTHSSFHPDVLSPPPRFA